MPDATTNGTGTAAPDLLASTGLNDPNSPWNLNGLLQTGLTAGLSAGQDALDAAIGAQTPLTAPTSGNGTPANPPAVGSAFSTVKSKWPIYLGVGAALALLAWILFKE